MIEPPIHNRLYNTCSRSPKDHQCGDSIEPGKPEDGSEDIPLGDIDVLFPASAESSNDPSGNQPNARDEEGMRVGGCIEPFDRRSVSEEDADDSEGGGDVPEGTGEVEHARVNQFDAGESAHEPEAGRHSREGGPTQGDGLEMSHPYASEGPGRASGEEIGAMQLDGCHEGQERADQKPEKGGGAERQDWPATGAVDRHAFLGCLPT